MLRKITLNKFKTELGKTYMSLPLSYELFGQPIGNSPVVLANHAMTANSTVTGSNGWWREIVGEGKVIDTNAYTVLAFNIPGNGYDGYILDDHKGLTVRDVARIFIRGLDLIGIKKVYAIIGGSVGGAISWEMGILSPYLANNIIPVATDWKATDWVIANLKVQDQILKNSPNPLHDARIHAMNFYRTPQSYKHKFDRFFDEKEQMFQVESWLLHHGQKIKSRYTLEAYKLMNHLVSSIDITKGRGTFEETASKIKASIFMIGISTDMLFISEENKNTLTTLLKINKEAYYSEIESIHGHDAFLIEYKQLETILKPIFK